MKSNFKLISRNELGDIFCSAGLAPGDIAMVHSRLFTLGRIPVGVSKDDFADVFINALSEVVGPEGTLIFPTFTLSTCKTGFYNVAETKSEMGALSERARLRGDAIRTLHPIFSVAVLGNRLDIFKTASLSTCFGENSSFDILHQLNSAGPDKGKVKFMTIGIESPPEAISYIHSIEEKMAVPYRYHKNFRGIIRAKNEDISYDVCYFVRDLSTEVMFDKHACWSVLKDQDGVITVGFGNSSISVLSETTVFETLINVIVGKSDFLCRGGYKKEVCI
ncbi:MAG: AAC(3) family N-acetyltransferase [Proteobacteria bacterium]|nr:AAC(3) family N-acetyltransferase [Pseudomonadota bacterium]